MNTLLTIAWYLMAAAFLGLLLLLALAPLVPSLIRRFIESDWDEDA